MSVGFELSSGLVCVTGLSWESAASAEFNQIKKQVKSDDIRACFFEAGSAEEGQMVVFGTIASADIPFEARRSKGNPVSLAGLLAASNTDERIIAIQEVERIEDADGGEEPLFWFCAINEGQVVADSDIVGPWSEIEDQVLRYRSIMADGNDTLIGNGVENLDPDAELLPLEQYLKTSEIPAASIKALATKTNPLLIVAAVLFFLGAGGSSLYTFVLKDTTPERPQISQAERQARMQENAEQALADAKASTFATADMTSSLNAIMQRYVAELPVKQMGWQLESVTCTQQRCDAQYENTNLSPIKVLREAVGSKCLLAFDSQGETASCALPIEIPSIADSLADTKFALMSKGRKELFTESLLEIGRRIPGGAFQVNPSEALSFSGSNFIDESEIPLAGSFGVRAQLSRFDEMVQILGKNLSLGYTATTISLADGTIEVSGNYYEKGVTQ